MFNPLFESLGWLTYDPSAAIVDGYTGATPLSLVAYQPDGWAAVTKVYSDNQMLWGAIPGSIGETSKPLIIFGALFLIITGVASWRIMVSMLFGAAITAILLNAWGATPYMQMPWYYHFYIGSFFFAMAFMATDPVTAAATNAGKWAYGFFIGVLGVVIRVLNPAYPEGWMLAILFMNVLAPLIDYINIQGNIGRRLKRAKAKA